ncbi:MAG: sigma-70 family RNA polymerase sigma factor [bacterium]|nr:sigma-70 family RNA polymerase sigma factor [bacterium]
MAVFESTEPVGVFEQYRPDVYGWAYRLLGHHHDAQDTAQDVFLRWLAQSRRALPNNPRGWLRQVTVNRAIDLLRARRSSPSASDSVPEAAAISGTDPLEQQELRGAVAAGLERLTEAQRGVLIAKVYDGLTFAQIANELGLAIPTVKTHYLRALAGVRDALSPRWAPERT